MTTYRAAEPGDRQFILSGWSASLRMSRDVPLIAMEDWAAIMRPVIDKLIDRPGVRTTVAAGGVLQGFITHEPEYVYYVYVAQPFRRRRIARGLFAAAGIDPDSRFGYSCRTKTSWELLALCGKCPQAYYDPYRARFPAEQPQERHEQRNRDR